MPRLLGKKKITQLSRGRIVRRRTSLPGNNASIRKSFFTINREGPSIKFQCVKNLRALYAISIWNQ